MPQLLWHGASFYNGHLRGSFPLTPVTERLAVELWQPVFYDLGLTRLGFEHPSFRLRDESSNRLRHRGLYKSINLSFFNLSTRINVSNTSYPFFCIILNLTIILRSVHNLYILLLYNCTTNCYIFCLKCFLVLQRFEWDLRNLIFITNSDFYWLLDGL